MKYNNLLIVDACCLINICASGKLEKIINGTRFTYLVSKTVHDKEMLDTNLLDSLNSHGMKYNDVIDKGLLKVTDFSNELEIKKFFYYARIIEGDGEAASLAIAESKNFILATDDNKAITVSQKHAPHVKLITTPELVKSWVETSNPSKLEIKDVIKNITRYGRFRPSKKSLLKSWWEDNLK